jgi:hypothetical protein
MSVNPFVRFCYAVCVECYQAELVKLAAEAAQKKALVERSESTTAISIVFTILVLIAMTGATVVFALTRH